MKKRMVFLLILVTALAALPPLAAASPEKSASKLEVTYYYLPT
ncbi:MAG TPA: hypothetical protein VKG01_17145 [Thermoanaerobaculia bacterium]|nr:hypothetical protein [Thermoanaerobaculia bacterium]